MASLKDIRRRIDAVKNTQKVTRAMKLVSAAKLKRAQNTAHDARAYSSGLYRTAMRISKRLGPRSPLMWRRPKIINGLDLVVVTSDRGLCGGFNENLLRIVEDEVINAADHNIEVKLYAIGRKGIKYLTSRGHEIEAAPAGIDDNAITEWIIGRMSQRYKEGLSAGGNVAFNRFVSTVRYEPVFWNLFPLHSRGDAHERNMEYLYEPDRKSALESLCMEVMSCSMKQTLVESRAAELAARMTAMDNATRNADDMIAHLSFVYNRARQESITTELIDIVGGAEALK